MCSLRMPSERRRQSHVMKRRQPERVSEGKRNQAIAEADNQSTNQLGRGHRGNEDSVRQPIAVVLVFNLFGRHLQRPDNRPVPSPTNERISWLSQ